MLYMQKKPASMAFKSKIFIYVAQNEVSRYGREMGNGFHILSPNVSNGKSDMQL